MPQNYHIQTDAAGVKKLRRLLQDQPTVPGSVPTTLPPEMPAGAIILELDADSPTTPTQATAKQVTWRNGAWETVRKTVSYRNISGTAIEATAENPTRVIARPISNLGYCVEGPVTASESVLYVPTGTCCGECTDEANLQMAGGRPVHLQFNPPTIYCCPQDSPVPAIRLDWDESAGKYFSHDSSEWDCNDGSSTITFELDPSTDTLLVIDSVLGTVAHYNVHVRDGSSQLNCPTRWVLDETVTPMHDSDCAICGEVLCTSPYNVYFDDDCFSASEHDGSLPASWVVTHDEGGTGHINLCGTSSGAGIASYHKLNWQETPNLTCGWSSYDSRGAGCEVSGNCFWWTLRWCPVQDSWILETCHGVGCTSAATFGTRRKIPDASFDPQAEYTWTYNGTTFTLAPA